jgi:hypothetical protein
VSERERYAIEAFYYEYAALDLETSNQVYELWKHSYPPSPFRRPGRQLHEIGAVGKSIAGNTG